MGFLDTYLRARGISDPDAPLTQDQRSEVMTDKARLLEILERYTRNINKNFSSERIASLNAQVDYFDAMAKSRDRLLETRGKDQRVAKQTLQRLRGDLLAAQTDLATSRGSVNQSVINAANRISTAGDTVYANDAAKIWNEITPYFDEDPTMTNLQLYSTIQTLHAQHPGLIDMELFEAGKIKEALANVPMASATRTRLERRLPQAHAANQQVETAKSAINATNAQLNDAIGALSAGTLNDDEISDIVSNLQLSLDEQEAKVSKAYEINASQAQAALQEFQRNDYLTDQIKELVGDADPTRAAKLRDLKSQAIQNPAFQQWAEDHGYTLGFVDEQGTYFPRPADDRALRHFRNEFNRGPGKYGTMRGSTGQIVSIEVPGGEPEIVTPEPTFTGMAIHPEGGGDPVLAYYDSNTERYYVPRYTEVDGERVLRKDNAGRPVLDEYDIDFSSVTDPSDRLIPGVVSTVMPVGVYVDPATNEFMSREDYVSEVEAGGDPAAVTPKSDAYKQAAASREVAPPPKVIIAERFMLNATDSVQNPGMTRIRNLETGEVELVPGDVTILEDRRSGPPPSAQAIAVLRQRALESRRRRGDALSTTGDAEGAEKVREYDGITLRRASSADRPTLRERLVDDQRPSRTDRFNTDIREMNREARDSQEELERLETERKEADAAFRAARADPDTDVGPAAIARRNANRKYRIAKRKHDRLIGRHVSLQNQAQQSQSVDVEEVEGRIPQESKRMVSAPEPEPSADQTRAQEVALANRRNRETFRQLESELQSEALGLLRKAEQQGDRLQRLEAAAASPDATEADRSSYETALASHNETKKDLEVLKGAAQNLALLKEDPTYTFDSGETGDTELGLRLRSILDRARFSIASAQSPLVEQEGTELNIRDPLLGDRAAKESPDRVDAAAGIAGHSAEYLDEDNDGEPDILEYRLPQRSVEDETEAETPTEAAEEAATPTESTEATPTSRRDGATTKPLTVSDRLKLSLGAGSARRRGRRAARRRERNEDSYEAASKAVQGIDALVSGAEALRDQEDQGARTPRRKRPKNSNGRSKGQNSGKDQTSAEVVDPRASLIASLMGNNNRGTT